MALHLIRNHLAFISIMLAVTITGVFITQSDTPTGFFDDGAIYLIAAEIYSPYTQQPQSPFIYSYENYRHLPPGLSFLLAMTGAYTHIQYARLLVFVEFLLALVAIYIFFTGFFRNKLTALISLAIFLCMPGVWIEQLKIMSENQYLLLSFILLGLIQSNEYRNDRSIYYYLLYALIISAILLTRTIGFSLLIAILFWLYFSRRNHENPGLNVFLVSALSLLPLIVWKLYDSSHTDSYLSDFFWFTTHNDPLHAILAIIKANLLSLFNAIIGITILFWSPGAILGGLAIILFLFAFTFGLIKNINHIAAIYLIIYLAVLLIWPYPEDMIRFIYPVMPLFIIFAVSGIREIYKSAKIEHKWLWLPLALYFTTVLPAFTYLYSRYDKASNYKGFNLSHITVVYTTEDPDIALHNALQSVEYIRAIQELQPLSHHSIVLSLKPELLTYYGHLNAKKLPAINKDTDHILLKNRITATGASHILLSNIIFPSSPLGMQSVNYMQEYIEEAATGFSGTTGMPLFKLYRIKPG